MHYVNPFAKPGQWYRGNIHTHSSVSDGVRSVSECFEGYKQQKYDFLVLTDHDVVSDVSHFLHDLYQGWIIVKNSKLSLKAIMDSLIRGSFHCTQGPEIVDFRLEESTAPDTKTDSNTSRRVAAKFSPSVSVVFKAAPRRGKHIRAHENQFITEVFYDLAGGEKYVRLEITAPDGKKAWSQPIVFRTV